MKTKRLKFRSGFTPKKGEILALILALAVLATFIVPEFLPSLQDDVLKKLSEEGASKVMLEPVKGDVCNILYFIGSSNKVNSIKDISMDEFDPNCLVIRLGFVESKERGPNNEKVWIRPDKMPIGESEDTQEAVLNRLRYRACMVIVLPDETNEGSYKIEYLIDYTMGKHEIMFDVPQDEFDPSCLSELGLVKSPEESGPDREVWIRPGTEKMPTGEANKPAEAPPGKAS